MSGRIQKSEFDCFDDYCESMFGETALAEYTRTFDRYKKFWNSPEDMIPPIPREKLPKFKADFRGLIKYAREKGVPPAELSEEERDMFITPL